MTMKATYSKKVIASSIALTLLLGGGALYGTKQLVNAEPSDAQAAAVAGDTAQQKPGKSERGEARDKLPIYEEAAAILGIDKETLKQQLKEQTLVQVAASKGISEADLIAKLQAERTKKLDEAVAAGKLTAEKAAKMKEHMAEHLKFMVNHKGHGDEKRRMHGGKHGKDHLLPAPDKLAGILGITEDQLKAELKSGKSLTDIAASKGISKEQLVAKIKEEITPWIEKMVDLKHEPKKTKEAK
jgi:uncharacterized protein YidB (DUF937 family)